MKKYILQIVLSVILVFGYVQDSQALKCYNCSSFHHNSSCDDEFMLNSELLVECPEPPTQNHLQNISSAYPKAISCRKLRQSINGMIRITRSCGYVPEQETARANKCLKEAFTSFTSSIYCECATDQCNAATKIVLIKWNVVGFILVTNLISFFLIS